jgi:phosphatidylinositol-3-phosphatase
MRRLALTALITCAAIAGAAIAVSARSHPPRGGLAALRVPARLTLTTLGSRGLPVHARVRQRDRVLALTLRRDGRTVARRAFALRHGGSVSVRWRLRSTDAGSYVLRARSGRDRRHLHRGVRRARIVLVGAAPGLAPVPGPAPPSSGACGTTSTPPTWQHVVWIVFENKTYDQIVGNSNAPYINGLAKQCGLATNFSAEAHPSLPNYIAMTSGSTQGISDDSGPSSHPLNVESIFSQVVDWRSLEESMPSNCDQSNSGLYAVRHNPAAYYTNVATACASRDVPMATAPDISARFTFVTPNLCNDMHSCPTQSDATTEIKTADAWLSTFMPKIVASQEYQSGSTAVFITWDEDDYSDSQHIVTIVVAPSTLGGLTSGTAFNHYSMLRTTEEMLGTSAFLGKAATATSMRSAFHL